MSFNAVVICVAVVMYIFSSAYVNKRNIFCVAAAALLILLSVIFPDRIFMLPEDVKALDSRAPVRLFPLVHLFSDLISWNFILFYVGSSLVGLMLCLSRLPEKIACALINRTRHLTMVVPALMVFTGILSAFAGCGAAVTVMVPLAINLCTSLGLNPALLVSAVVMASNLEFALCLTAGEGAMAFGDFALMDFGDFFVHGGRLSVFACGLFGLVAASTVHSFFFRKHKDRMAQMEKSNRVRIFPCAVFAVFAAGLAVLSCFRMRFVPSYGIFACLCALVGILGCAVKFREDLKQIFHAFDWRTLVQIPGVLVVTAALRETGVLYALAEILSGLGGTSVLLNFILVLASSLVFCTVMDGLCFMVPFLCVASVLAEKCGCNPFLFTSAVALGAGLGSSVFPWNSKNSIAACRILKEHETPSSLGQWAKTGIIFAVTGAVVSGAVLWMAWGGR